MKLTKKLLLIFLATVPLFITFPLSYHKAVTEPTILSEDGGSYEGSKPVKHPRPNSINPPITLI